MKGTSDIVGTFFKFWKDEEFSDYQVLIGFAGWGNVGYYAVNHFAEILELETIGAWGYNSWFHKGRIESIMTAYKHEQSKTIIIASRVPIPVTQVNAQNWDTFATEVLSWKCKRYVFIGGLREETRGFGSTEWSAMAPNMSYIEKFKIERTMPEKLSMIGPLSSLLVIGTSLRVPVLGILAYCNQEDDPEASVLIIDKIMEIMNIKAEKRDLVLFDYSHAIVAPPGAQREDNILDLLDDLDEDEDEDDFTDFSGIDPNQLR